MRSQGCHSVQCPLKNCPPPQIIILQGDIIHTDTRSQSRALGWAVSGKYSHLPTSNHHNPLNLAVYFIMLFYMIARERGVRRGRRRRKGERGGEVKQEKSWRWGDIKVPTYLSIFGDVLFLPEGRLFLRSLQLIRELVTGVCKGGDVYTQVSVIVLKALNLRKTIPQWVTSYACHIRRKEGERESATIWLWSTFKLYCQKQLIIKEWINTCMKK